MVAIGGAFLVATCKGTLVQTAEGTLTCVGGNMSTTPALPMWILLLAGIGILYWIYKTYKK